MTLFYSQSKKAFFDNRISTPPADAREITPQAHAALMQAQAAGKQILPDTNGNPVAADRPAPAEETLWASLRRQRDQLLSASDWTQMPDVQISSADRVLWAAYRQQLRDLPANTIDPAAPVWPTVPN